MIRILVAGDFCPIGRVKPLFDNRLFETVLGQIASLTKTVDLSVLNLECPVLLEDAKPILKSGPNLKCNVNALHAIKWAGFDVVTLANNHFCDYGQKGVVDTIELCNKYDIETVGGGVDLLQAQKPIFKNMDGKKVAFLNFCENEFSIATNITGGSSPLNPIQNYYQIKNARLQADFVIVIVHGGHEGNQLPSPRMQETYRFFIDSGADVVVNHHQHCYSGYETYKDKPIFYGLGNFCFDWNGVENSNWNNGYLVELILNNEVIDFKLHPYRQCNLTPTIELLNKEEYNLFVEKINMLNKIILSASALSSEFDVFTKKNKAVLSAFEPYQGRYLSALLNRGLLPSFMTNNRKRVVSNLIRCEAHRDLILKLLSEK